MKTYKEGKMIQDSGRGAEGEGGGREGREEMEEGKRKRRREGRGRRWGEMKGDENGHKSETFTSSCRDARTQGRI